jgi:hypothetical protein
MTTSDEGCTREIQFNIAMTKAAFNRKETLFTSTLELNLRKKLVSATFSAQHFTMLKLGRFEK